ncbi:hypothetical protein BKA56DRAFT_593403 [Ilyonectria sp. MPI-CAGE-AT-0026]|nr:hypothetical protein BKA56DRAFT_593403 [Ilyonectria sp. MPI-CAGE-AT-0026]
MARGRPSARAMSSSLPFSSSSRNSVRAQFPGTLIQDSDMLRVENITGGKIECIFQDPVFTQSDKDFLASLGHQVVETPAACGMIDANSLLYGIHLYRPIYAMALEKSLPAIFVGTGWDVWDDLSNTEGLEKMEEMEKTYTRCAFPQDSHGQAFSSTSIYWKPAPEAATASSEQEAQGKPSAEDEISSKLESTTIS